LGKRGGGATLEAVMGMHFDRWEVISIREKSGGVRRYGKEGSYTAFTTTRRTLCTYTLVALF
jgi:hypothetical protein